MKSPVPTLETLAATATDIAGLFRKYPQDPIAVYGSPEDARRLLRGVRALLEASAAWTRLLDQMGPAAVRRYGPAFKL